MLQVLAVKLCMWMLNRMQVLPQAQLQMLPQVQLQMLPQLLDQELMEMCPCIMVQVWPMEP